MSIRPTWDETRMAMAKAIAERSLCTRQKVGAIVTDNEGGFVGEGYNGPPSGYLHGNQPCNIWCKRSSTLTPSPDYTDCYTIHAETNALLKSDYSRRVGGTIYVTSHVCWGCAKMIANSGLSRVVVEATRPDLHRDPVASYTFLRECGLEVVLNDAVMMTRLKSSNGETAPDVTVYESRDARSEIWGEREIPEGTVAWLVDEEIYEVRLGGYWILLKGSPAAHMQRTIN